MKRYIFFAIILICCLLAGCTGENYASSQEDEYAIDTAKKENEEAIFETDTTDVTEENTYQAKVDYTQILEKYKALYESEDVYSDLYLNGKFLIVGKSSVVCLIVIGDIEDATVISKENIAKTDDFVSSEFGKITIYDKTGDSISIMVIPEETKDIIASIYEVV